MIKQSFLNSSSVTINILRLDRFFAHGNKHFKLKFNLETARMQGHDTILTFGGAYSNHIAAVAQIGNEQGFKTVGIIRGEELRDKKNSNPTLAFAKKHNMTLDFISRSKFREKHDPKFHNGLKNIYGDYYMLPEGGTNELAIKGAEEILRDVDISEFTHIAVAAGTGGTAAGLLNSVTEQKVLVFSALKGNWMRNELHKWTKNGNFEVFPETEFGGYGRVTQELVEYANRRFRESEIPLDPIYTSKMMARLEMLIDEGYFSDETRILAIHTGGLQGIAGMNQRLHAQDLPIFNTEL